MFDDLSQKSIEAYMADGVKENPGNLDF